MSHLGPNELRFVEALRACDEPSEEDRVRIRAGILAKLAAAGAGVTALTGVVDAAASSPIASAGISAGGAGATLGAASVAGAPVGFLGLSALKLGLTVAGVAAAGVAAVWGLSFSRAPEAPTASVGQPAATLAAPPPARPSQRPEPPRQAASEPVPVAPSALPIEAEPRETEPRTPARVASGTGGHGAASSASPMPAGSLDAELALIAAAQTAMQKGSPAEALAALDRHATEFPRGVLALERAGLRIIALCQAGRVAEGESLAASFLARNPRSPLSARIRASCRP